MMSQQTSPPRLFDHNDYNKVVAAAELDSIRLVDLKYAVKPQLFEKGARKLLNLGYGVAMDEVHYDAEDNSGKAIASVTCEVTARYKRKNVVALRAVYVVSYNNLTNCNSHAVRSFVRRVGKFAVYPYFRSLSAVVDAESGARLPLLPIMKSETVAGMDAPSDGTKDVSKAPEAPIAQRENESE